MYDTAAEQRMQLMQSGTTDVLDFYLWYMSQHLLFSVLRVIVSILLAIMYQSLNGIAAVFQS